LLRDYWAAQGGVAPDQMLRDYWAMARYIRHQPVCAQMVAEFSKGTVLQKVFPNAPRTMPPAGQRGIWDIASDLDRGAAAEARLGGRTGLPFEYPTIDRFENGVATSVKTIDLARPSYQNVQQITSTGQRYIDQASSFAVRRPVTREGITIRPSDVTQRAVDLVVPPWSTPAQRQALQGLVEYGARQNPPVVVRIVELQ
jgi:hypothetical protein